MDESAVSLGFVAASILLDLEKFYDNVSLLRLMEASMTQGFPPVVTLLEVQLFLAPRVLKSRTTCSDLIFPGRSIVAGSGHGVKLAKVFLGPILQAAHDRAIVPTAAPVGLWTFVDDTVVRSEGVQSTVRQQLRAVGAQLVTSLAEARPPISDKRNLSLPHLLSAFSLTVI